MNMYHYLKVNIDHIFSALAITKLQYLKAQVFQRDSFISVLSCFMRTSFHLSSTAARLISCAKLADLQFEDGNCSWYVLFDLVVNEFY